MGLGNGGAWLAIGVDGREVEASSAVRSMQSFASVDLARVQRRFEAEKLSTKELPTVVNLKPHTFQSLGPLG